MAIFKRLSPTSSQRASAPSTYPAPGGCPSTTQPSPNNSHADCGDAHDARGDRTRQEYVVLSTSASGFPRPAAAPTQQTKRVHQQARYPREPHRAAHQQGPVQRHRLRLRWSPELEDVLCRLGRFVLWRCRRGSIVCGFVQFARKADAERAIEKMGFRGFWWVGLLGEKLIQAGARASPSSGTSARPAFPARPGARHSNPNANPNLNPNANAVGGTTPALLKGMMHGAPAGFGCRALQLLLPRPSDERDSVRAALRRVNSSSAPAGGGGRRELRRCEREQGVPQRLPLVVEQGNVVRDVHVYTGKNSTNDSARAACHGQGAEDAGGKVPVRGAYEMPAPSLTATGTFTSSFSPFSSETHQLRRQHQQPQQRFGQQQQPGHGARAGADALYAAAEILGGV
ncbi:hypothetical protein MSAN_02280800 [Mycena sanguinolenta]|uniref:RRM domain-containing protein n=1 Tax=Mycena sanguinolenta TaxID=230812 RepID=A0A8H6XA52_9AGAR|nr:hypothetical protein MSAN_02280800 [Mycena sanguinolenta]